ncbi:MAG: electron transfer flavoprotein subunit alpha [Fibrobacteria bacterium]|nr:electron transfer flavoprotein subunit alpha [Fibrobacteria bacterium]
MEKILFIANTESDGSLSKIALEVLGSAIELAGKLEGSTLSVGLFGTSIQEAANSIADCGAASFSGVEGEDFADSRYCSDIAAVSELIGKSEATLVLAPANIRISRVLPGAAVRCNGKIDSRISRLSAEGGKVTAQRWFYRQRMTGSFSRDTRPWIMSMDAGSSEAVPTSSGTAHVDMLSVALSDDQKKTKVLGTESPSTNAQTIKPDANILFVAGAGWTKKQADGQIHAEEAEKHILGFLEKAKASLGSSKSLVDQGSEGEAVLGFMSHLNQIGQTGASPRHQKGLATCCHGEEPHVIGWRFINERRAVNADANCGWAQGKADVLYVADAFEVMTKVNELL